MEAFNPTPANAGTTPWLSDFSSRSGATFLFRNAYSCHFQTVPTLERALTEMNQYNNRRFVDSVSVVELAQSLGMEVYWYSNQGHIGVNDTPVTLVAESSQHSAWTSQRVNHQPYDEELLEFLPEIKSEGDKLVVFHLKGSHFTYSNRYPASAEFFPTGGGADYVAAYRNSIRYTDGILQKIFDHALKNWNLQAMVYCSDHADVPDRRRSPNFDGFGQVRIPLAVVVTEGYAEANRDVCEALAANQGRPFSNDLLFDLMAGLWRVEGECSHPELSLASAEYSLRPETTFVYLGSKKVGDDPNFQEPNFQGSNFRQN